MKNGGYIYNFNGLYDNQKESFNSFDTIIFKNNSTIFISKNWKSKRVDSLIVNEKTLSTIIKK